MKYMVSYDLNKEDKDYDKIQETIKSIAKEWCKPCESTFIIDSNLTTTKSVFDKIHASIDSNDHLVVVEVSGHIKAQSHKSQIDVINKFNSRK